MTMESNTMTWNCEQCPRLAKCKRPCPPISFFADGDAKLKEKLIFYQDGHLSANYNDFLADKIAEHRKQRLASSAVIQKIRAIHDQQQKAVACLLHGKFTVAEVAALLNLTTRRVYKIISK